jgi:hypothetical protein
VLAIYCAYGHPLLDTVFGGSLTSDTTNQIYYLSLPLAVAAVPTALVYLTAAAALAVERAQRLFGVALASVIAHAVIVISLSTFGAEAVAIGQIASATVMACVLMAATFGAVWLRTALAALSRSGPAFVLTAIALIPRVTLGRHPALSAAIAGALLSGLVYIGLAALLWRGVAMGFFAVIKRPQARV